MRPDELASQSHIERDRDVRKNIKSVGKSAASLAAGVGLAGASAKIAPFLDSLIPADLAMKGINKMFPKVGEFLQRGKSFGLDIEEGLDFVKEKFGLNKESEKKPAQQNKNIVEQYSPELHSFITDKIKEGRSPLEAIGMATLPGETRFKKIIDKMTKETNMPLSAIIESSYGAAESQTQGHTSKEDAAQKYNQHQKGGSMQQETERFNQAYGKQGPGQSNTNQTKEALLQAVLEGNQVLKGLAGG